MQAIANQIVKRNQRRQLGRIELCVKYKLVESSFIRVQPPPFPVPMEWPIHPLFFQVEKIVRMELSFQTIGGAFNNSGWLQGRVSQAKINEWATYGIDIVLQRMDVIKPAVQWLLHRTNGNKTRWTRRFYPGLILYVWNLHDSEFSQLTLFNW